MLWRGENNDVRFFWVLKKSFLRCGNPQNHLKLAYKTLTYQLLETLGEILRKQR